MPGVLPKARAPWTDEAFCPELPAKRFHCVPPEAGPADVRGPCAIGTWLAKRVWLKLVLATAEVDRSVKLMDWLDGRTGRVPRTIPAERRSTPDARL